MDLLKIEFMKIKKFGLITCAILIPVPAVMFALKLYSTLTYKIDSVGGLEILRVISSSMYIGMLLPILIMYVVCVVTKVENDNNGWKQIMSMPLGHIHYQFQ